VAVVISTAYPAVGRDPRKTPATIDREKSISGTESELWVCQNARQSSAERITTSLGAVISLVDPCATVVTART
jgi:hypothetical protein